MNKEFEKTFGTDFLKTVPDSPGVYIFRNQDHVIVYVGKAKHLKKRLAQYKGAGRKKIHRKMRKIIKNAAHVEFKTCDSEIEALLLENQLIQEHRPALNISGTFFFLYPYIGIAKAYQNEKWIAVCYSTAPEALADTPMALFGAFRSKVTVLEAYRSLNSLLTYLAHKDHKKTKWFGEYDYSTVSIYRQVNTEVQDGLEAFLRGESSDVLGELAVLLLEKPHARSNASDIQIHLKVLSQFFKEEAHKFRSTLDQIGDARSFILQNERDKLFLLSNYQYQQ